jgi:cellulose biosynthesis protein BcsQ
VLIDTSPTPSLLHGVFYTATDHIIYPTELALMSFDGLVESIKHRMAADNKRSQRWGMPPIDVLGIVPMKYRGNTVEQQDNLAELRKQFGATVWEPIAMRTDWTESESRALPVFTHKPDSAAALDAWELVDRVEEVLYVKA